MSQGVIFSSSSCVSMLITNVYIHEFVINKLTYYHLKTSMFNYCKLTAMVNSTSI